MSNFARRRFIKLLGLSSLGLLLPGLVFKAVAASKKTAPLPTGEKPALATDAIVVAIGYKPDVKDLDYAKYPQRKKAEAKDQFCKSCAFYKPLNDGWGKCQMIAVGVVSSSGWCGSYNKKV